MSLYPISMPGESSPQIPELQPPLWLKTPYWAAVRTGRPYSQAVAEPHSPPFISCGTWGPS